MKAVTATGFLASLGTCLLLTWNTQGQQNTPAGANLAVQDPLQSADVEVLTRGPVHEAFAQVTIRRVDAFPIIKKQPPEAIKEIPAELRPEGEAVVWIPGYWAFDVDRDNFLWVSGIWRLPPPQHEWMPGYWRQAADGWQWVPGYWAARGETEVALYPPPPDPIPEAIPPMPEGGDFSGGAIYVPGNWVHQNNDYWWQSGFWTPARQGWTWSPSRWMWNPSGYSYTRGFWDYDLSRRGMLFSPVAFQGQPWMQQPNWSYQPRYGVYNDFLMNNMFARVGTNQFWFGDYFDPRYQQMGFSPWMNYRVGGQFYDPLFAYYRWQNRNNAQWEAQLRATAQARYAGKMAPLPRTLLELQQYARADAKANVRIIGELNELQAQVGKLTKVTQVQRKQMAQMAEDLRDLAQKRAKIEATARTSAKVKTDGEVVRVKLARPQSLAATVDGDKAPPLPKTLPLKVQVKAKGNVNVDGQGKGEGKGKVDGGKGKDSGQNPGKGEGKQVDNPGKGSGKQVDNPGKGGGKQVDNPGKGGDPGKAPDRSSALDLHRLYHLDFATHRMDLFYIADDRVLRMN